MNKNSRFVIQRQRLKMTLGSEEGAYAKQTAFRDLFYQKMLPRIEEVLEQYDQPGMVLRVDRLQIDLGDIDLDRLAHDSLVDLESQLRDQIVEQIHKARQEPGKESEIESTHKAGLDLLRAFLEWGTIPWSVPRDERNMDQLVAYLAKDQPEALIYMLKDMLKSRTVLLRLIRQFSDERLQELLAMLTGNDTLVWISFLLERHRDSSFSSIPQSTLREEAWRDAYRYVSIGTTASGSSWAWVPIFFGRVAELEEMSATGFLKKMKRLVKSWDGAEKLKEVILELKAEDLVPGAVPEDEKEIVRRFPKEKEDIYIDNAGMVLISPFIEPFLEHLDMLEGEKIKEGQAQRAVLLIQYLVTGDTEFPEHELLLNKLICGLDIEESLPASIVLTSEEETECIKLLESVIQYWETLRHSSIEDLRKAFLIREGRLTYNGGGWDLMIDRQTFDILLDKLPWSYGIVKLPWMKEAVFVEW